MIFRPTGASFRGDRSEEAAMDDDFDFDEGEDSDSFFPDDDGPEEDFDLAEPWAF